MFRDGGLQAADPLPGDVTVGGSGTLDGAPGVAGELSNAGTVVVQGGDQPGYRLHFFAGVDTSGGSPVDFDDWTPYGSSGRSSCGFRRS